MVAFEIEICEKSSTSRAMRDQGIRRKRKPNFRSPLMGYKPAQAEVIAIVGASGEGSAGV